MKPPRCHRPFSGKASRADGNRRNKMRPDPVPPSPGTSHSVASALAASHLSSQSSAASILAASPFRVPPSSLSRIPFFQYMQRLSGSGINRPKGALSTGKPTIPSCGSLCSALPLPSCSCQRNDYRTLCNHRSDQKQLMDIISISFRDLGLPVSFNLLRYACRSAASAVFALKIAGRHISFERSPRRRRLLPMYSVMHPHHGAASKQYAKLNIIAIASHWPSRL